jgi:hypothetical protein
MPGQLATKLLLIAVALLGVAVAGWSVFQQSMRDIEHQWELSDAAELTSQYASYRIENGNWPDADKLYGAFFTLQSSVQSGEERIDTWHKPDGTCLQFTLGAAGRIRAEIDWKATLPAESDGRTNDDTIIDR